MNIPYDIPEIYCAHCHNVIEGEPKSTPECCDKDICESCVEDHNRGEANAISA
jgi:hypothetical protein